MDTEKHVEIEKKVREGLSLSDEGPYYHHAWWESYKGGVKGKLGGAIIGTLVGAAIGAIVATTLIIAAIPAPLALVTLGVFTGTGLVKGLTEFSEVGKIVGAGAAQSRMLESRIRTMMDGKVAEIKQEIGGLKSLVSGAPIESKEEIAAIKSAADKDETNYRKSHYAKIEPDRINSFAFWKVALIGLAVGAIAGLLLAMGPGGGVAALLFEHMGLHLGANAVMAASIATMGALGASFGINRDLFRRIFDKTDLLFKGVTNRMSHAKVREHQIEAGEEILTKVNGKESEIATTVFPENNGLDYPKSETHFRDKVLPAAQRALLSFDHTRATPQ